jgi:hypothetical protein
MTSKIYTDVINRQVELSYVPPQNFYMVVDLLPTVTFNAQQIQIPTISGGEALLSNRFNPSKAFIPGDGIDFGNLDVTFLIDKEFRTYLSILQWMKGTYAPETTQQFKEYTESRDNISGTKFSKTMSNITVVATDAGNQPLIHWNFYNCFPVSLDGPQFDSTQPDINYLTSTVSFRHHYFTCQTYTNGQLNDTIL